MNAKLTLTIDQSVILKAKAYAKDQERSLSDLIENYLKSLTREQDVAEELTPIVKSLLGSFNTPDDFDYKAELSKGLSEKYLR
ncbi:MAG: hypothetical protein JW857_03300 [Bacteroidales bacterium]|nr:hypothetical protein [Bacteroidales bacterium]